MLVRIRCDGTGVIPAQESWVEAWLGAVWEEVAPRGLEVLSSALTTRELLERLDAKGASS